MRQQQRPRTPRPAGGRANGAMDVARPRRAAAQEALRAAQVRLEEAQASGEKLRRVRQLRSELQERLAIVRSRLGISKLPRNGLLARGSGLSTAPRPRRASRS